MIYLSDVLIPVDDIQNAIHASKIVYDDEVHVGSIIPYTGFKVTLLKTDYLHEKSEGVRVLLAEKDFTTIIAFRGTDGYVFLRHI